MFNIFRDEGEEMADSTQVRELFKRVQHPQLLDTVKALEVRADLDGISYTKAANHLTASVSKMPEYQLARKVAGIQARRGNSGPRKGGKDSGTIYNSRGKVHTGYYRNWRSSREDDRNKVNAAHKHESSGSKGTQFSKLSKILTEEKASIAIIAIRLRGL